MFYTHLTYRNNFIVKSIHYIIRVFIFQTFAFCQKTKIYCGTWLKLLFTDYYCLFFFFLFLVFRVLYYIGVRTIRETCRNTRSRQTNVLIRSRRHVSYSVPAHVYICRLYCKRRRTTRTAFHRARESADARQTGKPNADIFYSVFAITRCTSAVSICIRTYLFIV